MAGEAGRPGRRDGRRGGMAGETGTAREAGRPGRRDGPGGGTAATRQDRYAGTRNSARARLFIG
jgi:hypothetical protein